MRNGLSLIGGSCLLALMAAASVAHSEAITPAVSSIAFHDSPAKGGTYQLGERVQVEVRFDREVATTGRPHMALTIGTELRHALYTGWGGRSLYFNYIVHESDRDQDGIRIAANALTLNGGTVKAADGSPDADLTHGAVAAATRHKVDGSIAMPPVVKNIFFNSPEDGDTYQLGEKIELLVEFHRPVAVTGMPRLSITIGTQARQAVYTRLWEDGRSLQFSYTVQEGDRDEDGFSIPANALALNGGTIMDATGTADADLTSWTLPTGDDHRVNGSRIS